MLQTLVAALLALVVVVVVAEPASAHTELEDSEPAAGSTVETVDRIVLRFTEPIELAATHVWLADSAGFVDVTSAASHLEGDRSTLTLPVPSLGEGAYEVSFHVLATDGTPLQGSVPFVVTPPAIAPSVVVDGADPAADPTPNTALAIPVDETGRRLDSPVLPAIGEHAHGPSALSNAAARGLLNASLATLVGGLAFVTAVWPQGARLVRTRQVLWIAALLAAFASFELVAFQHAAATGLGTIEALAPWNQWEALQFRFGRIAAARVVLLAISAVLTARLARRRAGDPRPRAWSIGAAAVALGLAETVALLGHDAEPGLLASGARLVHVLAVSTWIGGLVMLLCVVLPRRRVPELVAVLPRFSALASGAVAVLTIGGMVLAIDLVGTAGALPTTEYGRVLLLKVAIVGVLLAAAASSRRHVRSALLATGPAPTASVVRPLAMWVTTEVGLMGLVLGLTALLVTRTPPG